MEIHWNAAMSAGTAATTVMTAAMYAVAASGIRADIPWILGLLISAPENRAKTYAFGFLLHFAAGIISGLAYAVLFAAMNIIPIPGWLWGLFFGIVHYVTLGLALVLLPAVHPRMGPGQPLPLPGLFGKNLGPLAPLALLLLHLVYGTVFGAAYALSF